MNWVKVFNEGCKEIKKEFYSQSNEAMDKVQEVYDEIYDVVVEVGNLSQYSEQATESQFISAYVKDKLTRLNQQLEELFYIRSKVVDKELHSLLDNYAIMYRNLEIRVLQATRSKNDLRLASNRSKLWNIHMRNNFLEISDYVKEVMFTDFMDKVEANGLSEVPLGFYKEKEQEPEQKEDIKNIFSWKDMEDLAIQNGYSYKNSNGSHRIYEHSKTCKIVVIPSHELGKGLSNKIQKQIYANSK